jgi:branched-chain amino acid transport system substrate-binding protein
MRQFGKRSAISTAAVVVIVVVLVVVAAVGTYAAVTGFKSPSTTTSIACSSTSRTTASASSSGTSSSANLQKFSMPLIPAGNSSGLKGKTVTIGLLDDLTDGLSSDGIRINASANLAASDINNWLIHNDTAWSSVGVTFKISTLDYALDNSKAQSDLSTFVSQGVNEIVGPLNSGTLGAVEQYVTSNQLIMISPSSTSVALAGTSPYVFRTAPNDAAQGLADAREMYQEGVRGLIIVYRQDTYGQGLAAAVASRFTALGGHVLAQVPYDPTITDFSSVLSTINQLYTSNVGTYGCGGIAIQAISFEELGTMLLQAKTSYPQLLNTVQPWYGSDGEADDSVLTNSTYASVMNQIELPSTLYIQTNTTATNRVCSVILSETHISCDAYALGAYDDVWLAALGALWCGTGSSGSVDTACVSREIPTIANESVGVTGPLNLEANHDRVPMAYDIWCVTGSGTAASWNTCGTWTISSDTVAWTAEPPH